MHQIRWGLIGCGDVARKRVAQAILDEPRSRLIAACRRDKTKLHDFCNSFGVERAYTTADELIADADIDAVYIATPVREHLPQTLAAARAGRHVLVEKPMALAVSECDQMIASCHEARVKLGVAYYRRFYPVVFRIQELLQAGEIGTPMAVSAVTASRLAMQPGEDGYWRVNLDEGGGGALMDIGSHRINVFLHLFGEVAEVKALCDRVAANYEAEDTALLLLRFHSGQVGTLQCHFGSIADPDELTILGTRGRLVTKPFNGGVLSIEANGRTRTESHPPADNLCAPLVIDFVSAVLEDREPTVTGEEGREANLIMERAYADANSPGN